MELKLYSVPRAVNALKCFNRTFMELKHVIKYGTEQEKAVLIGPSWN